MMSVSSRTQLFAFFAVLITAIWTGTAVWIAQAQNPPELERIPFQIATGPVSGSYLQAGEAIAITISHPSGLVKCQTGSVCGPSGLIATTRSSSGSISNALAVQRRSVQSALVQGDVLLAAIDGTGPFADEGSLKDLRVLARLHDEVLHVAVSTRSRVKRLKDLQGKRIAIDTANLATEYTVRQLFSAAGLRFPASVRRIPADRAAEDIRAGKIDALFVLGVAPVTAVDQLMRRGYARLLGLDARTLQKLSRRNEMYSRLSLAAGTYRSSKAVQTLGVASVWIVHKSLDRASATQIVKAFWNPANQRELKTRGAFAASLDHKKATAVANAPLHDGAQRFYANLSR